MSSSSSSANTAPGSLLADGQLGARPKNSRQLVANGQSTREKSLAPLNFNPSSTPSSTNKEWNSNWNSVLSFQEKDCSRRKMMNGQPPSVNSSATNAGSRMMSISRGSSDPSLAIQPVSTSHLQQSQQQQQHQEKGNKKKEKKKEKSSSSLEFYHCQSGSSYQRRQLGLLQGDRPSVNASRSSSAADLSRSYSIGSSLGSNNSNSLNNIQDPASLAANTNSGTGITSIWWRWFRRNNNNNNRHRRRAVTGPAIGPSSPASPASRSQSAENSPVINRRSSKLVGKSSLAAGEKFKQSDSLSTDSFAFIRPSISSAGRQQSTVDDDMMIMTASQQQLNHPMALRIKYGLIYSAGSTERVQQPLEDNQMEGEAIRAMRTRWELQMRQVESGQQQLEQQQQQQESSASATTTTSRKKRPAPQPPVATSSPCPSSSVQSWSRSLVQSTNSQPTAVASRSSLASSNGRFAHVPGKRKAPSPPPLPQQQQQQQTTSNTDGLNIPPAPPAQALTNLSNSKTLNSPSSSNSRNIQTGQEQQVFRPRPTSFRIHQTDFDSDFDQPIERTTTATTLLLEKNKWTNDLNSNLMDANAERMTEEKSIRYHQNKINNGHRHQGPSCPHNDILKLEGGLLRPLDPTSPVTTTNKETPASTMSSVDTSAHRMTLPLKPWYKRHHSSSSASSHHHHQHPPRSKWKDAALLHPPRSPDEGLGWRATAASPAVSPESTLTVSTISSPGGSTRSGGSSSDGSKKRKSLLVNISQLDREAAEIIQRERARESQRKKMQDDKFYSIGQQQLELPVVLESAQSTYKEKTDHGPSKGTKELIDMFNSLSGPVGWAIAADEAIDSQGAESMGQGLGQGQQHANSNNKTLSSQEHRSSNPVNAPADAASSCPSESLTSIPSPTTASNNNTNNNTITRLRVNRTTVETPVQPVSKEPASIFIPKFERKSDSPLVQPRPSLPVVEYTGGARPKKSSVLLDPAPPATPRLVNGPEEPVDKCPAVSGWACHVCTLVNSDARLWCEACTALKPRRPALTTSSTSSVPDKAVPDKAASTRSLTQPEMTNENKENRDLSTRLVTAGPTKGEKAVVQQPPSSDFIRPSSPEALRQARLAFFLNGLNGPKSQSETASQSAAVEPPTASELDKTSKSQVRDQTGDKNNNININVKRHSQHGLTGSSNKVSSGCQTVSSQPTLASIKMRPLSEGRMDGRLSSSDSSSTDSRTEEGPVPRSLELSGKRIISPDENNLIGLVDKDKPIRIVKSVNPTDFASSIISPSRTQLSQYLQQRERDRERDQQLAGSKRRASTQSLDNVETVDSNQNTSTDEKRVDILLWRLEESIACGQFDKAAVLAKELAAIKRPATAGQTTWTNNTKPEQQTTTANQPVATNGMNPTSLISAKPVAAPRSILPAPVHPPKPAAPLPFVTHQIDHQSSSTIQVQAVQDSTTSPSVGNKNNNNSQTNAVQSPPPRPAKRHSISNISKEPTPPPKNNILIWPEEPQISLSSTTVPATPVAPINKEETPTVVTVNPVELREPSPAPVAAAIKEEAVPVNQIHPAVVPQVSVRAKKSKVSSGQQTTLSYQRKSTAGPPVSSELEPNKNSVKIPINNNGKERSQSCIIDHTFNVEVFIEDRSTHSGPFPVPVRPATTLLQLKERMEKEHSIPVGCQRWILGRRLAHDHQMTLQQYDICPSNSSLYLYVLDDHPVQPVPAKIPPTDPPLPRHNPTTTTTTTADQPEQDNARKYYNYQEDRYSTCDEDSDDEQPEAVAVQPTSRPVAAGPSVHLDEGWTCPDCKFVNPMGRPGCESCPARQNRKPENAIGLAVGEGAGIATNNVPDEIKERERVDYYKKLVDLDQSDVVANADDFDCSVCLMTVPSGVGITLRECLHNFCRDCLAHVIEFSDEAAVICPYRDNNYACDAALQEREIKALVGAKVYEKHLERSMRLAEKAMKNTFHCQTADCTGWAIIEDNVNVFKCPVCRQNNCLTCQAIHEGANCKEYQDRVNQSAETDEDAKRTKEMIDALMASGEALSCPQCQVVLMKRWGCDWVRCSVCRTEICWVTRGARWGPKGKGDTSGGCRCGLNGVKCHPQCNYCH